MKAVVIGSGNVATHLCKALKSAQINVVQVWSQQLQNAEKLANEINAEAINDLSQVNVDADFCIISVKDDAVETIANQLQPFKGIVVHTAGAVSIDIFKPLFKHYGVLYPLQTFSKGKALDFKEVPLCIEAGDEQTLKKIEQLAQLLSRNVYPVDTEKRKILHLAAVFACNFTNHLYALSQDILAEHQLPFDIIKPLIVETAEKVQHNLPRDVQTGPAIRHDEQTLARHRALLANQPHLLNIYQTLTESIKKTN
ncbi:Rossmann-like and DUF2520 domain-containing protein [Pedobacter montanisoli]|uniref:DUF2520 domain-containing protein n=1 Tax=Pedobacter montanisoli TaxID=2923277 RepID=A0ABS9ZW81_9SPHI|nr:Rossmann-like and DUF2520 domain-containing protein [Pedobacter montanisoli]MCJ0742561.1 DUF2520 domain-containing protein [Pedobacter montanisoli]